jgi:hypothetical protein
VTPGTESGAKMKIHFRALAASGWQPHRLGINFFEILPQLNTARLPTPKRFLSPPVYLLRLFFKQWLGINFSNL